MEAPEETAYDRLKVQYPEVRKRIVRWFQKVLVVGIVEGRSARVLLVGL